MGHVEAMHQHLWCMYPGESTYVLVGNSFAFKPGPGPGGVDLLEVSSLEELAGEFEVVKDAEDCLGYTHKWLAM